MRTGPVKGQRSISRCPLRSSSFLHAFKVSSLLLYALKTACDKPSYRAVVRSRSLSRLLHDHSSRGRRRRFSSLAFETSFAFGLRLCYVCSGRRLNCLARDYQFCRVRILVSSLGRLNPFRTREARSNLRAFTRTRMAPLHCMWYRTVVMLIWHGSSSSMAQTQQSMRSTGGLHSICHRIVVMLILHDSLLSTVPMQQP